eukprot:Transcript_25033.p1 GENE.Transcript_25033~~Transcript_25033.p1  ORF type:complete len:524 (-),score=-13.43 Transcript_25033:126-1562(-)
MSRGRVVPYFEGCCGETSVGVAGDCTNGDRGAWPLGLSASSAAFSWLPPRTAPRPWREKQARENQSRAVSQCVVRCQSCRNCAFVSISVRHNACLWFGEAACDLNHLSQKRDDGFRSYRVPTRIPSSCVQEPEETAFAMVLDKLSKTPVRGMRNSSAVADLTREVGLVNQGARPLYGCEHEYMHSRGGFGMFQLPEQVGCLLTELARVPTPLRTFAEIGSWYGWTGLFFTNYARRLFEARMARSARQQKRSSAANSPTVGARLRGSRREFGSPLGEDFHAASFDIYDLRTPCVKALMAQYGHGFHRIPHGQHGSKRPTLKDSPVAAARWYEQRFAESHLSSASALEGASKIDLCFIDAEHSFGHVRADVRFFQPRCRFLMFHDIVDGDAYGVRAAWHWLSRGLMRERDRRAKERAPFSNSTAWAVEQGYFVKECTQQAGTRRRNFGLGIISAKRLNASWLDACTCKYNRCNYRKCQVP